MMEEHEGRPEMKREKQRHKGWAKPRRSFWWGVGLLALLIVIVVMWWKPWQSDRVMLTADAAAQSVLDQYPGEIVNSTLKDGTYIMQLRSETGLYDVQVDAVTATVNSIKRLESNPQAEEKTLWSREQIKTELLKQTDAELVSLELVEQQGIPVYLAVFKMKDNTREQWTIDPYTGEKQSSKTLESSSPDPTTGEGTKTSFLSEKEAEQKALARIPGEVDDIELRGTNSGNPYYLVEIDLEDGREAIVQVNAISGAIRSVTWDDDDD
ncbi:PepSY domain-containing protein [Paenibacillus taichungensis]|uniref:PepSY domain-containing protein n=2 Tax=Paenibacillus taichungensis TaxID=484184 RepID=UPI002DB5B56F|nr:PepSY domain-containing protein [Paenibacillus taichungensis]MEC0109679.1 PepSY domain-containing protein [Paenibacillus taichungensis]